MIKKGNEKFKKVFFIIFYLTNNLECFQGGIHEVIAPKALGFKAISERRCGSHD